MEVSEGGGFGEVVSLEVGLEEVGEAEKGS